MKTLLLKVNPHRPKPSLIKQAAKIIRRGGLVAFPTETVYGLGANALSEEAVAKIFKAKQRPANDPIIVHIASKEDIHLVADEIPAKAYELIQRFWPGPLTLVLPKSEKIPKIVTAGLPSVGVRMPKCEVALELIKMAGVPIAAPSANLFGRPSPTRAEHVLKDLEGKVEIIIDGGSTEVGVESTVLDITTNTILRPGGISRESLEEVLGEVSVFKVTKDSFEALRSPGMMKRHYAPRAKVLFFVGEKELMITRMKERTSALTKQGMKVGVMVPDEYLRHFDKSLLLKGLGPSEDLTTIAKNLFSTMRSLDEEGVDFILTIGLSKEGLGLAIFDRLLKAAGSEVIK
jgi:L-threonylcarbamoyladenylate synthase